MHAAAKLFERAPLADAHKYFVGVAVLGAQIVRVGGGHERDFGGAGNFHQGGVGTHLLLVAVVLDLQEEMPRLKQLGVFFGYLGGLALALFQKALVDDAAEACREAVQALAVLF